MKLLRTLIEWIDGVLDCIPAYSFSERRWYRHGGWGCVMHMHKLWDNEADYDTVS